MLERAATQAADSRGSQGSKRVLTRGSGLAAHVAYVHKLPGGLWPHAPNLRAG